MSIAIDPSKDLAVGSYQTIFYPGKTGLKFDKGRAFYKSQFIGIGFSVQIDSATVSGNNLIVLWSATNVWGVSYLWTPNIEDGVKIIKEHFEEKNPGEAFSIQRTIIFTEGVVPPRTPGDILKENIEDPLKKLTPDLSDLTSKIGIALIVLAVALAFFAGYKAFGKSA